MMSRRQLHIEEIRGFNADVICLQEVDQKQFEGYYIDQMRDLGFEGVYLNKAGSVKEVTIRTKIRNFAQE